jgi:glycosyltransferase involved in cell wall biosynthesis
VIPTTSAREDVERPYAISLGSANRDYALLFEVLAARPVRTIVVASKAALEGLDVPDCVEVMSGLSLEQCHDLLQGARVSIIPVANPTTASGQVTLLNSMGLGRATIITRCPGSVDYVVDGETAVLVSPGSREEMANALDRLWTDDDYRTRLGRQGRSHVIANYSDEAIGRAMGNLCDLVEARVRGQARGARR